ncbi:MAG: HutD/Ves family protein [Janthinobacterium lividum]
MTGPRLIRAADARRMPWKNGGGETIELLAHPAGAGLDAFDWRVSMATVATDGPFSIFPGVDRTLTVLDGDGLDLFISVDEAVRLTADSAPLGFPADAPCRGRLLGGPVTDLNVMTRRARFSHKVTRLRVDGPQRIAAPGATIIAVCLEGEIAVGEQGEIVLDRRDIAVPTGGEALNFTPTGTVAVALIIVIAGTGDGS